MLPHEIDVAALFSDDNILWVTGVLAALPLLLTVVIAVAVVHGNRVRRAGNDDPDPT